MKNTLKLFCLFFTFAVFSPSAYSQIKEEKALRITFSPLGLVDPITGNIQLGFQKSLSEKWALSIDFGLKFDKASWYHYNNTERFDYKYSKYKLELKRFFVSNFIRSSMGRTYVSAQGFYFPQRYVKYNSYVSKNFTGYRYDRSDITRNVFATSVLLGDERTGKNMTFDYFFGFGIRQLNIKHQISGAIAPSDGPKDCTLYCEDDLREGITYKPNVILGFKIGYQIKKK